MGLTQVMILGTNFTMPLIRASSWVTVGGLQVSTPLLVKQAIHGTLINFNRIYIGQKERIKISEVRLKQAAATLATGEAIVTSPLILVLFNTDDFVPSAGSEISFPTTLDEDDILCAINIPATAWTTYKTGYAEAIVQPNIIVEGDIADANLGVNIHGILIDNGGATFAAAVVLKIQLKTELLGNADDD